ncbi:MULTISPECIES: hypothetical protein [Pseudomonas]|nr:MULTISPECIES: hypothetical protein [Pseudomonas]MBP2841011.1 hypothetical protein [Pseudomonas sp. PNP]MDD2080829.1 hypothetical protein [Pseudomonas putida]QDW57930.1 hypothetical protein FFH79_014130 [Pseudomonas sp. KBS0802]QXZ05762.1 hypothetical protein HG554_16260 [Pseudomonas putida]UUX22128.1 hypothetical protein M8Z99_16305 [Pseudomonas putida]
MIPDKFKGLLGILKSKLDMGLSESTGMQRITSEEVKWSKGPSLSILPYGLELAGVTPSPMLSAEPKNKKNCFKFYCSEQHGFYKSDIYGVNSTAIETEIYQVEGQSTYSVRFDDEGKAIRASGVIFENRVPDISCRLEDDGEYWCYEYRCEAARIVSMLAYASNSAPGTEIFIERDGESVVGLYFYDKNSKVHLYKV